MPAMRDQWWFTYRASRRNNRGRLLPRLLLCRLRVFQVGRWQFLTFRLACCLFGSYGTGKAMTYLHVRFVNRRSLTAVFAPAFCLFGIAACRVVHSQSLPQFIGHSAQQFG